MDIEYAILLIFALLISCSYCQTIDHHDHTHDPVRQGRRSRTRNGRNRGGRLIPDNPLAIDLADIRDVSQNPSDPSSNPLPLDPSISSNSDLIDPIPGEILNPVNRRQQRNERNRLNQELQALDSLLGLIDTPTTNTGGRRNRDRPRNRGSQRRRGNRRNRQDPIGTMLDGLLGPDLVETQPNRRGNRRRNQDGTRQRDRQRNRNDINQRGQNQRNRDLLDSVLAPDLLDPLPGRRNRQDGVGTGRRNPDIPSDHGHDHSHIDQQNRFDGFLDRVLGPDPTLDRARGQRRTSGRNNNNRDVRRRNNRRQGRNRLERRPDHGHGHLDQQTRFDKFLDRVLGPVDPVPDNTRNGKRNRNKTTKPVKKPKGKKNNKKKENSKKNKGNRKQKKNDTSLRDSRRGRNNRGQGLRQVLGNLLLGELSRRLSGQPRPPLIQPNHRFILPNSGLVQDRYRGIPRPGIFMFG